MEKGFKEKDADVQLDGGCISTRSGCSVSIVFSEEGQENALESSMEALEARYAEKSTMR